jgi:ribosomal protein L22
MSAADEKDEKDAQEEAPRRRRRRKKAPASEQPSAEPSAPASDPAADAASEPAADTPKEPAGDTPKEPAGDTPKEPAGDTPKEPATDAPQEPAAAKSPAAKGPAPRERRGEPEEKRQKLPARRARGAKQTPTRRVVRARARYVRTSARKARMICGELRGKSVPEARAILAFTPREVARAWSKLLESAVANAESNHELLEDDLVVREAYADEGPTMRRFRPRAMGRATTIRKRTSHLTITLAADSRTRTTKR